MTIDYENSKNNSFELLKIFLVIFLIGFVIWYLNGGPEKWEKKMMEIKKEQELKEKNEG